MAFVDAARGTAMLAVFCSHFIGAYRGFAGPREATVLKALRWVTLTASPAFMLISGLMLGLLHDRNRECFAPTRARLIDRGLTLLFPGHVAIGVAVTIRAGVDADLRSPFITDAIGLSLILGALVVVRLAPQRRLLPGAACLLASWLVPFFWAPPPGSLGWHVEGLIFGSNGWPAESFPPPLAWLGVFVLGSAAGPAVASLGQRSPRRLARGAATLGLVLVAGALALKVALRALVGSSPTLSLVPRLHDLSSLTGKFPPSPAYLLFYGGLALLLFALVAAWADTRIGARVNATTALFGRTALVSFIAQFYVYSVAMTFLPHPRGAWMAPFFLLTVLVLHGFARFWDRANGNRWLTVGYTALATRAARTAPLGPAERPAAAAPERAEREPAAGEAGRVA